MVRRHKTNVIVALGFLIAAMSVATFVEPMALAQGQDSASQTSDPSRLPQVAVSAGKEVKDPQTLPMSVTTITGAMLTQTSATTLSDVQSLAPNTFFWEPTARRMSSARFRGVFSSPTSPGVTTFIDGVPQLNTNSSSIQLMDIDQVEFFRGTQGALFGPNTIGGAVNVTSTKPLMTGWKGNITVPLAKNTEWGARMSASGPLKDDLGLSFTLGQDQRNGFTINDVTGNTVDDRKAMYGKAQLYWKPSNEWESRLIVSGERDRDGDYAFNDLLALRKTPFHVQRNFVGFTRRDVMSSTFLTQHNGDRFSIGTTTGVVRWKTNDNTDVDYSTRPLLTRDDTEKDMQLTQDAHIGSSTSAVRLTDGISLRWQTGVYVFKQNYDLDAVTVYPPFLLSPQVGVVGRQHLPQDSIDDLGVSVYGQATAILGDDLDVTYGMRFDRDNKDATLGKSYEPAFAPATSTTASRSFTNRSPRLAATYHIDDSKMIYGSYGRGFKIGGFNGAAPTPTTQAYDQENAWHVEGGIKTAMIDNRLSVNSSVFYIDTAALQIRLLNPNVPGQFYVTNFGNSRTEGVEFEINAKPHHLIDIFGTSGLTRARFGAGTQLNNQDLTNKILPNTPGLTMTAGSQLNQGLFGINLFARGEIVMNSGFEYDEANTQRQTSYSLVNYRVGMGGETVRAEFWVKNAFDTRYIPVAVSYGTLAPSGFLAEMGAPRRYGVRLSYNF